MGFTLPITPGNGNTLERSFFWVEMKCLKSFTIPLKGNEANYEGGKPQSEATPKYPVQGQSNEGYKITPSGKPSSSGETRIQLDTQEKKRNSEGTDTQTVHLYYFLLFKGQLAIKCPTLLQLKHLPRKGPERPPLRPLKPVENIGPQELGPG